MSIRLSNLIYEWIQNNPDLKEHIKLSADEENSGVFIETKCGGRFTMAWVSNNPNDFSPGIWNSQNATHEPMHPSDPEYFNKLERLCRQWHNSYRTYTYGCKTTL